MYESLEEFTSSPDLKILLEAGVKKCFQPDKACDFYRKLCHMALVWEKDHTTTELLNHIKTEHKALLADWLWNINVFLDASESVGYSVEQGLKLMEIQPVNTRQADKYLKGRLPIIEYAVFSYAKAEKYEKIVRLAQEVVVKNHQETAFGHISQKEAFRILLHYFNMPTQKTLNHFSFNSLRSSINTIGLAFQALKLTKPY